jgi:hypothetical protein
MDLRDVAAKYRAIYTTLSGAKFRGEILTPPQMDNPSRQENPRQFLKVHPDTRVAPGTIMVTQTGRKFLLLDNGDSDRERVIYKTFKLIQMDHFFPWTRAQKVVDPVTGLNRSWEEAGNLGSIWCALEPDHQVKDASHIPSELYNVLTNADLQIDDHVGPYQVKLVLKQLGVTSARVD